MQKQRNPRRGLQRLSCPCGAGVYATWHAVESPPLPVCGECGERFIPELLELAAAVLSPAEFDATRKPVIKLDVPGLVKAFGHPLRVRILAMIDERSASPRELVELLDTTLGPSATRPGSRTSSSWSSSSERAELRGAIAHDDQRLRVQTGTRLTPALCALPGDRRLALLLLLNRASGPPVGGVGLRCAPVRGRGAVARWPAFGRLDDVRALGLDLLLHRMAPSPTVVGGPSRRLTD